MLMSPLRRKAAVASIAAGRNTLHAVRTYRAEGRFGAPVTTSKIDKRTYAARAAKEPFLNGSSSVYVEEMYRSWVKDPSSVHKVGLTIFSSRLNFNN